MPHKKFIFITGGVLSSLGKGLAAASIGALLESRGLRVTLLKMDPYLNVDPGTMSPYQHGEVFVTDDGAETDLDLGHYERFTNATMTRLNSISAGKIYETVINKERAGNYLGRTVQVIPHVTNEIKDAIKRLATDVEVVIVEVGGTVGDIESLPFLEAIRQLRSDVGPQNVLYLHVTLVPYVGTAGELKTKPTQHSVKELREIGIQPDILLCRCDRELPEDIKAKIALYCNLQPKDVISAPDVPTVYEVPLTFLREELDTKIVEKLGIYIRPADMRRWEEVIERFKHPAEEVNIGIVGKYVHLVESYKSLNEALIHGGIAHRARVKLHYLNSEDFEGELGDKKVQDTLKDMHAILVPGGFGDRGIEGKIRAIQYAREHQIPFLGICLGMQLAVIEYARHVVGLEGASSREFDQQCTHPVIDLMEEQKAVLKLGGTMRLGNFNCALQPRSLAAQVYGDQLVVHERHRHRYEVNSKYRKRLESKGLVVSGVLEHGDLVEMVELKSHPWFLGLQAHPEFKSKPLQPHPVFAGFVRAALEHKRGTLTSRARGNGKKESRPVEPPPTSPEPSAPVAPKARSTSRSAKKEPTSASSTPVSEG